MPSFAQNSKNWGLGIILGEPTGLSAKKVISGSNFVDFALAYSLGNSMGLLVDYLWKKNKPFGASGGFGSQLAIYYGLGGFLMLGASGNNNTTDLSVIARIPVGLAWHIPSSPIELALEIAPGLQVIPSSDFAVQGGIASRFFF